MDLVGASRRTMSKNHGHTPATGPKKWAGPNRLTARRTTRRTARRARRARRSMLSSIGSKRSVRRRPEPGPRPAHFRTRRHHEPAADLGPGVRSPGRHVSGGLGHRRPRRSACLLSRAGECRASAWVAEPQRLGGLMSRIDCRGGQPKSERFSPMRGAKATGPKVAAWFLSAMPWRNRSTICARVPASSDCATLRHSCSRRATIRSASRRSARSRVSPAARFAASPQAPRMNSRNCCARRRPTLPAA